MPKFKVVKKLYLRGVFYGLISIITLLPLQFLILQNVTKALVSSRINFDPKVTVAGPANDFDVKGNRDCQPTPVTYTSFLSAEGRFSLLPREVNTNMCVVESPFGVIQETGPYIQLPATSHMVEVVNNTVTATLIPVPGKQLLGILNPLSFGNSISFLSSINDNFEYSRDRTNFFQPVYNLKSQGNLVKSSDNKPIAIKSFAFSRNGEWMVAEAPNKALIKINTTTLLVQPFDLNVAQYTFSGNDPAYSLAISSDGNSVIRSGSNGASGIKIYDLIGCLHTVETFKADATIGCESRDITNYLQTKLNLNIESIISQRFDYSDHNISGLLKVWKNNTYEIKKINLEILGINDRIVDYIALGDSFASGEGELQGSDYYARGTDSNKPKNLCHLSLRSYSFLAKTILKNGSVHNVACSGAEITDVYHSQKDHFIPPDNSLGEWLPGVNTYGQLSWVGTYKPKAITISMGGNDIGFDDKIVECVVTIGSCYDTWEERMGIANEISNQFPKLIALYNNLLAASPDSNIYVIGYPQVVNELGSCGLNVRFTDNERQLANGLIKLLNSTIKAAVGYVGVRYIDIENAFIDHRLCDLGAKAVNGLTAGNDLPFKGLGPIANESYHPNALGQELILKELNTQSDNLKMAMTLPDHSKTIPLPAAEFLLKPKSGKNLAKIYKDTIINTTFGNGVRLAKFGINSVTWTSSKIIGAVKFVINSEPVSLGSFDVAKNGTLNINLNIPKSVPVGYHTIHAYGKNFAGEDIDLYEPIFIAGPSGDVDNDGIKDSDDLCNFIEPSHIDSDNDGVDDACDGYIGTSPLNIPNSEIKNNDLAAASNINLNTNPSTITLKNSDKEAVKLQDSILADVTQGSVLGINSNINAKLIVAEMIKDTNLNQLSKNTIASLVNSPRPHINIAKNNITTISKPSSPDHVYPDSNSEAYQLEKSAAIYNDRNLNNKFPITDLTLVMSCLGFAIVSLLIIFKILTII